jgi:soluble P-type ATPase
MLAMDIPGFGRLELEHLILDYNGTLALDGELLPGVEERLADLAGKLRPHVLTADNHGSVRQRLAHLPYHVHVLGGGDETQAKLSYVTELGEGHCACLGNGRNDSLMLAKAALGIAVLGPEGVAIQALLAADLLAPGILPALDLLLNPQRLRATLRSG